MSVYFDASVIVSLFVRDAMSPRAWAFIQERRPIAVVSDFAAAEVSSALSLHVRAGQITTEHARAALGDFDIWRARSATRCVLESADVAAADAFLRRLDLPLRAPDAMHIAAAQRLDVELATYDTRMKISARALGLRLAFD